MIQSNNHENHISNQQLLSSQLHSHSIDESFNSIYLLLEESHWRHSIYLPYDEELQNKITTSILYYMKEKNITVDDICQATKISIKRLNNLINPNTKTTIKIRELYYISYVLGVSINKLVNKEN